MTLLEAPPRRPEVTEPVRRAITVTAAVAVLAAATYLANRVLPGWAYPLCGATAAALLVLLARTAGLRFAAIGLGRRHFGRGAVVGLIGLSVVALGFGIALAVPAFRPLFDDGRVGSPDSAELLWQTLIRIPIGTVLIEEVAFRGVLPALLGGGQRWRWGPVLGAAGLFGLWHLLPSLALINNAAVDATFGGLPLWTISVLAMVAAAGAGVFLHWWRHTGRSLLAPMAVHTATNSGGLAVAWWVLAHR